jgi:Peptidase family M23
MKLINKIQTAVQTVAKQFARKAILTVGLGTVVTPLAGLITNLPARADYNAPTGAVYIEHAATGFRLNLSERKDGGRIYVMKKDDSTDQKLWIEKNPDNSTFSIWVDNTYTRLSTKVNPTRNGTGLEAWNSGVKGSSQQTLRTIPSNVKSGQHLLEFVINGRGTGQCLDANAGVRLGAGGYYTIPHTWTCDHNNDNQRFVIQSRGGAQISNSSGDQSYLPTPKGTKIFVSDNYHSYRNSLPVNAFGIDLVPQTGNGTVSAVRRGTVVQVGYEDSGCGNFIVIEYNKVNPFGGKYGMYCHLNSVWVKPGTTVVGGRGLGVYGGTGRVKPHIHYAELKSKYTGVNAQSVPLVFEEVPDYKTWYNAYGSTLTSQNQDGRN